MSNSETPDAGAAAEARIARLEEALASVMSELRATREAAATPATMGSSTPATAGAAPAPSAQTDNVDVRRKRLPNPSKFAGSRKYYAAWARQMRDKLEIDAIFFSSNREAWYYVYSCLDTAPQQTVATYYEHGGWDGTYDVASFMEHLDRTFGDPNARAKAAAALTTTKMKENETFASFFPKFERTLAEAGAGTWQPAAQIALLMNALNHRLKAALVTVTTPSTFADAVLTIGQVAWKVEDLHQPRGSRPAPKKTDNDGDTPMTGSVRSAQAVNKDKKKKSPKKRTERAETRTCFACDKVGHLARDCPGKEAPRVRSAKKPQDKKEETSSEDSGSESLSSEPSESSGSEKE